MKSWYYESKNIPVYFDEVIGRVSTSLLEEELKKRNEEKNKDPKLFEYNESLRGESVEIEIDLDDYLTDSDISDIISGASDRELFCELKDRDFDFESNVDIVHPNSIKLSIDSFGRLTFIEQKGVVRDSICDMFGLSHFSTTEDILKEIKNKID